jgi:hypothetical protein
LFDSGGGVAGIERDVSRAGFEDSEERGGKTQGTMQSEADEFSAADAVGAEEIGDLIRTGAELAVGHRPGSADHGGLRGAVLCLPFKLVRPTVK